MDLRARAIALGLPMRMPSNRGVDRRLIVGATVFGIGWGLAGFCPGPAVVALAGGSTKAVLFALAMLAGMALFRMDGASQSGVREVDSATPVGRFGYHMDVISWLSLYWEPPGWPGSAEGIDHGTQDRRSHCKAAQAAPGPYRQEGECDGAGNDCPRGFAWHGAKGPPQDPDSDREGLGLPQNAVSQLESRSDLLLSTLRRYVNALGADLDLIVRNERRIPSRSERTGRRCEECCPGWLRNGTPPDGEKIESPAASLTHGAVLLRDRIQTSV